MLYLKIATSDGAIIEADAIRIKIHLDYQFL